MAARSMRASSGFPQRHPRGRVWFAVKAKWPALTRRFASPTRSGNTSSRYSSTLACKAKLIRDLHIGQLEPEYCRRELLKSNPLTWMISANGFLPDAGMMPPEVQAEARQRGLIPDLPAPVRKRSPWTT